MENTSSTKKLNRTVLGIVLLLIAAVVVGWLTYTTLTKNDESNIVIKENNPIPETKDGSDLPIVDPVEDKTGEILPPQESNPEINNQADITDDDFNFPNN